MITRLKTQYLISKLPPFVQQEGSCQVSSRSSLQWPLLGAKHFINPCVPQDRLLTVHLIKRKDFLNFWVHFAKFLEMLDRSRILANCFPVEAIRVSYLIRIFLKRWDGKIFSPRSPFILSSFDSLLLPHGSQELNSGHQAWHQEPSVPSHIDGPHWVHLNLCRDASVFARLSVYVGTAPPLFLAVHCMRDFPLRYLLTSRGSSQALSLH